MKATQVDLEAAFEDVLIEEIRDGEVVEVSGVDIPAIARNFTMFKSLGAPRAGANAVGPGLQKPLIAGDKACPARGYRKAVPEGADPATFDACLEDVMDAIEKGDLVPDDPDADPKSTAYAICTAGGAGKRAKESGMKEDQVLEIPAPAAPCHRDDCLEIAKGLGLDDAQAQQVFEAARTDYGAQWKDPNLLVIPQGMEVEDLVTSAAQSLGFIEAKGAPKVTLKGKNHWADPILKFLGVETRVSQAKVLASQMKAIASQQEEMMAEQTKSKEDLRDIVRIMRDEMREQRQFYARLSGVEIPAPAGDEEEAPAETTPAASVLPPGKRAGVKDVATPEAGATAPIQEPTTDSDRIARLEDAVGKILNFLEASAAPQQPPKRASVTPAPPATRRLGATKSAGHEEVKESTLIGVPVSRADRERAWAQSGHWPSAR